MKQRYVSYQRENGIFYALDTHTKKRQSLNTALPDQAQRFLNALNEACQQATELKPDLVLMDIMLKGKMLGTEAANEVRTRLQIPVVYLTANSDGAVFQSARDTNPFGYILKPFDEATLKVNIEMALYKHRMEREREDLIRQLQTALAQVKTLSGLIPICAYCKSMRTDKGYWQCVEQYVKEHSDVNFSHGVCPKCEKKFLEEFGVDTVD
jgi:AmiR/NasT family two-component response regulator